MRRIHAVMPAIALVLVGSPTVALASAPALPAPAASPAGVGFSDPVALNDASGTSTGGSEPSIEVDSKGHVFVSAPAAIPFGGCPFWDVHPDEVNAAGLPYEYRGTIDTDQGSVGGGDCDISISNAADEANEYDTVSVTSLSLANLTSNVTRDGGATWQPIANSASQQVFGVDREWQVADRGLDRHYLTVHDLLTNNIETAVAIDGGYQYVQNAPAIDPTTTPQALGTTVYFKGTSPSGNQFGTTVINPVTHKLYIPFIAADPDNVGGEGNAVYIAEGDPCAVEQTCIPGAPAAPIVWTNHLVYVAPQTVDLSSGFPAITIDPAGVVYLAWTGDVNAAANSTAAANNGTNPVYNRVFFTHSQPGVVDAGSWSAPKAIDPGTANSNVFPWMVAGDNGHVGVAWYASKLGTVNAGNVGSANNGANDKTNNDWHVEYASSADASTASPTWDVAVVSGTIHIGAVCDQGLNCADGTRTLLDFFDVALDPQGRPNIAYVSDTRSPGTADVQYTRQCTGTTLTGVDLGATCGTIGSGSGGGATCPASALFLDSTGDAGTPSNPSLDVVRSNLTTDVAAETVTFHIDVDDLVAPSPGTAQNYIYSFTYRGKKYYVEAFRSTDVTGFYFGDFTGSGGSRTSYQDITGSFDDANDRILITLGFADVESATPTVVPIVVGDVLSTLSISTGGAIGDPDVASLTPTADSAADPCTYTVGAADLEPVVPEVPFGGLLPLAAIALLGTGYTVATRRSHHADR